MPKFTIYFNPVEEALIVDIDNVFYHYFEDGKLTLAKSIDSHNSYQIGDFEIARNDITVTNEILVFNNNLKTKLNNFIQEKLTQLDKDLDTQFQMIFPTTNINEEAKISKKIKNNQITSAQDIIDYANQNSTNKALVILTFIRIARESDNTNVIQYALQAYQQLDLLDLKEHSGYFHLYNNCYLAQQLLTAPNVQEEKPVQAQLSDEDYEKLEHEKRERHEEAMERADIFDDLTNQFYADYAKEKEEALLAQAVSLLNQVHKQDIFSTDDSRQKIYEALRNYQKNHNQVHPQKKEILRELWQEDRKTSVLIPQGLTYKNTLFVNELSERLTDLKKLSPSPEKYTQILQYIYSGDDIYLNDMTENISKIIKDYRSEFGTPDFYFQISRDTEQFSIIDYQNLIYRELQNEFEVTVDKFKLQNLQFDTTKKMDFTTASKEFSQYKETEFSKYKETELEDLRRQFSEMIRLALAKPKTFSSVQKHPEKNQHRHEVAKRAIEILKKPDSDFEYQLLLAEFNTMKAEPTNSKYKDKDWEKDVRALIQAESPRSRSSSTSTSDTDTSEVSRRSSEEKVEEKSKVQDLSEFDEDAHSTLANVNIDLRTNMIMFTIAKRNHENAYFQWDPNNPTSPAKQITLELDAPYYPCGGIDFPPNFQHKQNEVQLVISDKIFEDIQKLPKYLEYQSMLQARSSSTSPDAAQEERKEQLKRERSGSAPAKRELTEEEKLDEHASALLEAVNVIGKDHFNKENYDIFSTTEGRNKIKAAIKAFESSDDFKQIIEEIQNELTRCQEDADNILLAAGTSPPEPHARPPLQREVTQFINLPTLEELRKHLNESLAISATAHFEGPSDDEQKTSGDAQENRLNPEIQNLILSYRAAIEARQRDPQADLSPIDYVINNLSLAQTETLLEVFPETNQRNAENPYAEILLRMIKPTEGWDDDQQQEINEFRDLVTRRKLQIHDGIIAEAFNQINKDHHADIYATPESRAKIHAAIAYIQNDVRIEAINKEFWRIETQKSVNITSRFIPNSLSNALNQDLTPIKKHSPSSEEYVTALKYVIEGKQEHLDQFAENTELQQACINMRIRFTSPEIYLAISEENFRNTSLGQIQNSVSDIIADEIRKHDAAYMKPNIAFNDTRKSLAVFQSFEIERLSKQFEKFSDILIRANDSAPRYGNISAEEMAQLQRFVKPILELSDYDYKKQMFNAAFAKVASRSATPLTIDKIPEIISDVGTKNLNVLFYLERYAAAQTKKDQKTALTEITPHLKEILPLLESESVYQARVCGKKDNSAFTEEETQKVKAIFTTFKTALDKLNKQEEAAATKNKKQAASSASVAPITAQPTTTAAASSSVQPPVQAVAAPIATPVDQTLISELDKYKDAATAEDKQAVIDDWSPDQVNQLLEKFHIDAREEDAKPYKEHLEANQRPRLGRDPLFIELRNDLLARKRVLIPAEIMPEDNTPMIEGNYRSIMKDPLGTGFANIDPQQVKIGATDYVEVINPSLAATEVKNKRGTQEDRVVTCELPAELHLLSDAEIEKYIKQNIMPKLHAGCDEVSRNNLKKEYDAWNDGGGSCLLINFVIPIPNTNQYRIVTISLGDSTAFFHQGNNLEQLNPDLHNTYDPKERERIKAITGKELGVRFAGVTLVTGAMGDVSLKQEKGWQREPYVLFKTVEGDFTLLVACDGLTEADQFQLEQIQEYLNLPENRNKSAEELCELAQKAITAGSGDNISLIVVKNQPGMFGVFDGHGSSLISEWLRINTPRIVSQELTAAIALKKQEIEIAKTKAEIEPVQQAQRLREINAGAEELVVEQEYIRQLAVQHASLDQDVVRFLENYRNNPETLRTADLQLLARVEQKINGDPAPRDAKPYRNIYLDQQLNEEPKDIARISILQKLLRTEPEKRENLRIARNQHPKTESRQPLLKANYNEIVVVDGQVKLIPVRNDDDKIRAEIGLMDYTAIVDDNFAVTELLGHRGTQEDRCAAIDIPPEWSELSDEEIIYLIQNKVMPELHKVAEKAAETAFAKNANKPGACFLMNFIIPGKGNEPSRAVTVGLGDSTTLLHINGELKQLNPQLHNASEEDEKARVINAGGIIKKDDKGVDRLNGVMASGSMGDIEFNHRGADGTLSDKGYQRIPHICIDKVPANSDCTFFFACDGLTEGSEFEVPKLQELLNKPENQGKSAAELSLLAQQAIDHGNAGNALFTILQQAKGKPYEEIQQLILEAKNQNKIDEELYAEISQAITEKKLPEQLFNIARTAIHKGSGDNITNMVVKGARPGVYFVFDGHGGSEVSEILRVNAPDVVFRHFQNAVEAKSQNSLAISAEISHDKSFQSDAQLIADAYADKPQAYDLKKREQLNNALSKLFSNNSSGDVTVNRALYDAVIAKLPADKRNVDAINIKDHIENSWSYQRTVPIPGIADIPEKYRNGPHQDIKRLKLLCDDKNIYLNALQYIETGDPIHFSITNQSINGEEIRDLIIKMRSNFALAHEENSSDIIAKRRAAYEIVMKAIRHYDSTYKPEINNFKELFKPFNVATPLADDNQSKLLPVIQKDLTELIALSKSPDEYVDALQYILDGDLFKINFPDNQALGMLADAIRAKYSAPEFYLNLTPEIIEKDNIGTLRKDAYKIFSAAIPSENLKANPPPLEIFNNADVAKNVGFLNLKIPELNVHLANVISAYNASIATPPTDAACFTNRTINKSLELLQQSDEFYRIVNAKLASENIAVPAREDLITTIQNNWNYKEKYKTPANLDVKTRTEERFANVILDIKASCKTREDFSVVMQFIADGNVDAFNRNFKGRNKDHVKLIADQLHKDFTSLENYLATDAVTANKVDQINNVARVFTHLTAADMQNRMAEIIHAHSPNTQVNLQNSETWTLPRRTINRNLNADIAALKELYANKKDLNKTESREVIIALYDKMQNPNQNIEYLNALMKKVDQGEIIAARRIRKDIVITWDDIVRDRENVLAGYRKSVKSERFFEMEPFEDNVDDELEEELEEELAELQEEEEEEEEKHLEMKKMEVGNSDTEDELEEMEREDETAGLEVEVEEEKRKISKFETPADKPYLKYFYASLNFAFDDPGQIADQAQAKAAIKYLLTGEGNVTDENLRLIRNGFTSPNYYLQEREKLIADGTALPDDAKLLNLLAIYDRELRIIAQLHQIDISDLPDYQPFNLAMDNTLYQNPLMSLSFKDLALLEKDIDILIEGYNNTEIKTHLANNVSKILNLANDANSKIVMQAWFDYQKYLEQVDENLTLDAMLESLRQRYNIAESDVEADRDFETFAQEHARKATADAASTASASATAAASTTHSANTQTRKADATIEAQPIQGKIWFENVVEYLRTKENADKTNKYDLNTHVLNTSATFSSQKGQFSITNVSENKSIKFSIQGKDQDKVYGDIMSSLGSQSNDIVLTLRSSNASNLKSMIANAVNRGMQFEVDTSKIAKLSDRQEVDRYAQLASEELAKKIKAHKQPLKDVTNLKKSAKPPSHDKSNVDTTTTRRVGLRPGRGTENE